MTDQTDPDPETGRLGQEIFPFEMGYLPSTFFQRKAEVECRDNPENRQEGLKALKDKIECDKNFRDVTFDDGFLLAFLRGRKFDVLRALSTLKSYVNLRKRHANIFTNFKFENTSISTRNKIVTFLPYRCQDGCAILFIKLANWNPEEFPVEEVKRMVVIYLQASLRDIMTQVNGMKVIFDCESNLLRHLRHVTPTNIGLLCYGPLVCSPARIKAVHIVNQSLTFKLAFFLARHLLSAKMKNRLIIHSSPESLLDFFPAACMPSEYGGDLKDYDMTDWLRKVMRPENIEFLAGGKFPLK